MFIPQFQNEAQCISNTWDRKRERLVDERNKLCLLKMFHITIFGFYHLFIIIHYLLMKMTKMLFKRPRLGSDLGEGRKQGIPKYQLHAVFCSAVKCQSGPSVSLYPSCHV